MQHAEHTMSMSGMDGMDGGDMPSSSNTSMYARAPPPFTFEQQTDRVGTRSMNMFFSAGLPSMPLWFESWMPTSAGSTFGACVGLFALTILYRLLGSIRAQAERAWARRAEDGLRTEFEGMLDDEGREEKVVTSEIPKQGQQVGAGGDKRARAVEAAKQVVAGGAGVPFVWSQEVTRATLTTVHVGIMYFLMVRPFPAALTHDRPEPDGETDSWRS